MKRKRFERFIVEYEFMLRYSDMELVGDWVTKGPIYGQPSFLNKRNQKTKKIVICIIMITKAYRLIGSEINSQDNCLHKYIMTYGHTD